MKLENRNVVITGGGTGIGFGLAQGFARRGSRVLICGRREAPLDEAVARIPGLHARVCDVTVSNQIEQLLEEARAVLGSVDVLINNAGVVSYFNLAKKPQALDEQLRDIDIDLCGAIRMTHHFLPELLNQPAATILNVTSASAYVPLAIMPIYSAAKAALHSYTLSLRVSLRRSAVEVIEIAPPPVETPMTEGAPIPVMPLPDLLSATFEGLERGDAELRPGDAAQVFELSRMEPIEAARLLNTGGRG